MCALPSAKLLPIDVRAVYRGSISETLNQSAPPRLEPAQVPMRQPARAYLVGDILIAPICGQLAADQAQVAAVAVVMSSIRPTISNGPWLSSRCSSAVASSPSRASSAQRADGSRACRCRYPHFTLAELEGVAVDHAGVPAPRSAAGECLGDLLGVVLQEARRLEQRGIGRRPDAEQDPRADDRPQHPQPAPRVARQPADRDPVPVLRPRSAAASAGQRAAPWSTAAGET